MVFFFAINFRATRGRCTHVFCTHWICIEPWQAVSAYGRTRSWFQILAILFEARWGQHILLVWLTFYSRRDYEMCVSSSCMFILGPTAIKLNMESRDVPGASGEGGEARMCRWVRAACRLIILQCGGVACWKCWHYASIVCEVTLRVLNTE